MLEESDPFVQNYIGRHIGSGPIGLGYLYLNISESKLKSRGKIAGVEYLLVNC